MKKLKTLLLIISLFTASCGNSQNVAEPTLEEKVARMVVVGMPGVELTPTSVIRDDITKRRVGGVILFEANVVTNEEKKLSAEELAKIDFKGRLTKLTSELREMADYPLFIVIDQEGGLVNRLKDRYGFVPSLKQDSLGKLDNESTTRHFAASTAQQLKELGINVNFAPCVDVNVNPECPAIGKVGRSFSEDENLVTRHAQYVMEEHHKCGIITAIKHFPGHGSSMADTHKGLTDVTNTWSERELTPYRELLSDQNMDCNMVMVSHVFNKNIDPTYPATLSYKTITGILREKIGWDGVVITDDMHMGAITEYYTDAESLTLTINAGTDMIILSSNLPTKKGEHITDMVIETILAQVKTGAIPEQRIDEAFKRISRLYGDK